MILQTTVTTFMCDGGRVRAEKIEDSDREHQHDFLDEDLDPYPCFDEGAIGGPLTGDICPRCGLAFKKRENVYRHDGDRGKVIEFAAEAKGPEPMYHPECWVDRRSEDEGQKSTNLEEFM